MLPIKPVNSKEVGDNTSILVVFIYTASVRYYMEFFSKAVNILFSGAIWRVF